MKAQLKRGFTLIELLVVITIIATLAGLAIPATGIMLDKMNKAATGNNCKQVMFALTNFASENNTLFPDSLTSPVSGAQPTNANEAFRMLFQMSGWQDERIFGARTSLFMPDGNIGSSPGYEQAVAPGENHWAMTAGLSTSSPGIMPFVYENPVQTTWPPLWNADAVGQPKPGRTWRGGEVMIGRLDNSVTAEKLMADKGTAVGPRLNGGQDIFTASSNGQPQAILGIVTRSGGVAPVGAPAAPGDQIGGGMPPLPGGAAGNLPVPQGGGLPVPGGIPAPAPGGSLPPPPPPPGN
jgi:prepilin-type N-terminal cleavage/methylation domain-containing protein